MVLTVQAAEELLADVGLQTCGRPSADKGRAALRCVHLVETAERGLRVGDLVFEFPFGRIVDTGMACRRDGIVPPGLDLMTVHKEATAVRAAASEQRREVEGVNILPFRRAG